MKRLAVVGVAVLLLAHSLGCWKAQSTQTTVKDDGLKPEQVVDSLLQSMKTGNKVGVASLLTITARTETEKAGLEVQPPAMPNAGYQVMEAVLPPEDPGVAHVSSIWSEGDDHYEIIWVLRKEAPGWRIAGMAMTIDENQDPLFLNFENPAEMLKLTEEAVKTAEATQPAIPATTNTEGGELAPPALNPLAPVGQDVPLQNTASTPPQPLTPPTANNLQPIQPLQPLQPTQPETTPIQARQPQPGFDNPIRKR